MKKVIIFSALLVLMLMIGTALGVNQVDVKETDSSLNTPFQYPITPDSPEWKNYTVQELREILNIPIAEAESMDTETLLNVVLDYPYLGDIYAFNTPIIGFDIIAERFNGLKVLLEREDLKDKLVDNYINSSAKLLELQDNGELMDRMKHKYREALFIYPTILDKLSKAEKEMIISISIQVAEKINYSPTNLEPPFTELKLSSVIPGQVINYGTVYTPKNSSEIRTIENMTEIHICYCDYSATILDQEEIKQLEELFNGAEFTKSDTKMRQPDLTVVFFGETTAAAFSIDPDNVIDLGDENGMSSDNCVKSEQINFEYLYSILIEHMKRDCIIN